MREKLKLRKRKNIVRTGGALIRFTNFYQVVDFCKKLCVDGETTVERVARFRNQTLSKLSLKHENCAPENMSKNMRRKQ